MEVAIPKSLEALVRRKVDEGHYGTEEEVVADALRLMQLRDEVVAMKRDRLRNALDRGYEDVAAWRVIQLDSDEAIDSLFGRAIISSEKLAGYLLNRSHKRGGAKRGSS